MRQIVAALILILLLTTAVGCEAEGAARDTESLDVASTTVTSTEEEAIPHMTESASQAQTKREAVLSDLSTSVGVPVELPETAFGGIESVLVAVDEQDPERADVVYADNDVVVRILRLDRQGALDFVTDLDDDPGFGPWIKEVRIRGHEGRAHERLDVEAEWDAAGSAKPGTGVHSGAAVVMWSQGPFVVTVASATEDLTALLDYAEQVNLAAPE